MPGQSSMPEVYCMGVEDEPVLQGREIHMKGQQVEETRNIPIVWVLLCMFRGMLSFPGHERGLLGVSGVTLLRRKFGK